MAGVKIAAAANGGSAEIAGPPSSSANTVLKLPADTGSAGQVLRVKSANHSATNAELEWAADADSVGLADADQWRVTSNFSSADTIITSNWERVDARGSAGPVGTGFSPPSSGVFTFPSTGYWLVTFNTWCAGTSADWVEMSIHACLDGSSYNTVSTTRDSCEDGDSHTSMSTEALIDVTSTSDVKVKFDVKAAASIEWYGDTQMSETNVVFLKLGAT